MQLIVTLIFSPLRVENRFSIFLIGIKFEIHDMSWCCALPIIMPTSATKGQCWKEFYFTEEMKSNKKSPVCRNSLPPSDWPIPLELTSWGYSLRRQTAWPARFPPPFVSVHRVPERPSCLPQHSSRWSNGLMYATNQLRKVGLYFMPIFLQWQTEQKGNTTESIMLICMSPRKILVKKLMRLDPVGSLNHYWMQRVQDISFLWILDVPNYFTGGEFQLTQTAGMIHLWKTFQPRRGTSDPVWPPKGGKEYLHNTDVDWCSDWVTLPKYSSNYNAIS